MPKKDITIGALAADRFALNVCAIVGDVLVRQRLGEPTRYEYDLPPNVTGADVVGIEPQVPAILCRDGSVFSWIGETWRPVGSIFGLAAANGVRPPRSAVTR